VADVPTEKYYLESVDDMHRRKYVRKAGY